MTEQYRLAILNSHPIQYFAPLYRRLAEESNIDLTVYFCSRHGLEEYADQGFGKTIKWDTPLLEGYKYQFLPNFRTRNEVSGFLSLINPRIISELYRNKYDALWVNGHNFFTNLLAIVSAKLFGISVLMLGDSNPLIKRHGLKAYLHQPVMKLFYKLCDAFLAIGTRNAEYYCERGVSNQKIFLLPFSVDNKFFIKKTDEARSAIDLTPSKISLPNDKTIILYVAKLIPLKRPLDLLKTYHRLYQMGLDIALAFVGSGSEEEKLKEYVRIHSLPDVHFCGFRNQTELPQYLARADIFVLPSEIEAWGLAINEAMCAGLPIVSSEIAGAVADLIRPGGNGYTFPVGDIDRLTDCLATLVSNPELRKQMGRKSSEIIKAWSYEECVQGVFKALAYVKCQE